MIHVCCIVSCCIVLLKQLNVTQTSQTSIDSWNVDWHCSVLFCFVFLLEPSEAKNTSKFKTCHWDTDDTELRIPLLHIRTHTCFFSFLQASISPPRPSSPVASQGAGIWEWPASQQRAHASPWNCQRACASPLRALLGCGINSHSKETFAALIKFAVKNLYPCTCPAAKCPQGSPCRSALPDLVRSSERQPEGFGWTQPCLRQSVASE